MAVVVAVAVAVAVDVDVAVAVAVLVAVAVAVAVEVAVAVLVAVAVAVLVIGTATFEGPVVIDGKVEGEIEGSDKITVGENGSLITTRLRTDSIVIGGTVKVKSIASRRIEILPTGKVWGDLASPSLLIHEGAQFVGKAFARGAQQASDAPWDTDQGVAQVKGRRAVTTAQGE